MFLLFIFIGYILNQNLWIKAVVLVEFLQVFYIARKIGKQIDCH